MTTASPSLSPKDVAKSTAVSKTPAPTTDFLTFSSGLTPYYQVQYRVPRTYLDPFYTYLLIDELQLEGKLSLSDLWQHFLLLSHAGTAAAQVRDSLLIELEPTSESIRNLRRLSAGWNGYDIPAPKEAAIEKALNWLEILYGRIRNTRYRWRDPYVSADENGSVVLEWENEENGLAFYISGTDVHYLIDWGYDTEDEMEYGALTDPSRISELWERLNN